MGLAFDADVRHERRVSPAAVQALDALETFGDALLTTYAAVLRGTERQNKRMAGGQWVTWAERSFAERTHV